MKIFIIFIKNLIYSIISFFVIFISLIGLFLVMNIKISLMFSIILILLSFTLFCYCLYAFISLKKDFHFLSLKGISGLLSLSCLSIVFTLMNVFFFSINFMISTELGKNITIEEKIGLYMLPFQENKTQPINYRAMKENKLIKTYRNVNIYYQPQEQELLPIIEGILKKADSITTGLFGSIKDNKIDLILHSSSEDLYEKTALIETMGYFDDPNDTVGVAISDKEEILANRMPGSFYFQSTIMHEYTHYRLQAFIKEKGLFVNRIPLWFHEGVAEYVGMHDVTHRYYPFHETSFTKLDTHDEWEKFRLDDYDVYLQSYYAIKYLVDTYGKTMIKKIIVETAEVNDFNEGFTRATGITVNDLQTNYLEEAKKSTKDKKPAAY
ncbi:hypothetical protein WQ54_09210 [Bacillus sp. SA1-12]|uniref:peptidase MA family metallohydrolase n=1 Tax=Bacillus sp. SA1-12 TaxID=1455638 RepID=UPI000625E0E8|nr:hypothetical protein [Bacillus sp. SA1-12]KKI92525.1 hypothetical protein WQ54_09210 [Bacillus sp. SA1-12]